MFALLEDGFLDAGANPGNPNIFGIQLCQFFAPLIIKGVFDNALPCAVIGAICFVDFFLQLLDAWIHVFS